jgi:hypothetical protein
MAGDCQLRRDPGVVCSDWLFELSTFLQLLGHTVINHFAFPFQAHTNTPIPYGSEARWNREELNV